MSKVKTNAMRILDSNKIDYNSEAHNKMQFIRKRV